MCVGAPPSQQESNYTQANLYGGPGDAIYEARVRPNKAAIANVQARMDANQSRVSRTNPLVPGGTAFGALYTASNFFNARIIDSLQRGAAPVRDASGAVTGARDSSGRLTGRDPIADEAAAKIRDRQNQDDADARRRAEERAAAAQPNPASATAAPVTNTNRRPIIYDDQRLASAASRGPGRRSLLGS